MQTGAREQEVEDGFLVSWVVGDFDVGASKLDPILGVVCMLCAVCKLPQSARLSRTLSTSDEWWGGGWCGTLTTLLSEQP